jgi:hypothetical protein
MVNERGSNSRQANQTSDIIKKYGGMSILTLRAEYGPHFAAGFAPTATLADILNSSPDHASLSQMRHDHDAGKLKKKLERRA